MTTEASTITISCLCETAHQTLPSPTDLSDVTCCGCASCRHLSGQLWTTYTPLASPPSLANLTSYSPSPSTTTYFCSTCGCHLFRRHSDTHEPRWEVTTGTIISSPPIPLPEALTITTTTTHDKPTPTATNEPLSTSLYRLFTPLLSPALSPAPLPPLLHASCHCTRITFTITPPSASSFLPSSPFADLLLPYCRHPPNVTSNPSSLKWWLRDPYLAGTCACRSCRLASGFEAQAWAFVPRFNIHFGPTADPLVTFPRPLLQSYASSPAAGAVREFCPTCGATVFWHDAHRPDLIDVSVGLLCASSDCEGSSPVAAAYPYLYWWTERTSFAEESAAGQSFNAP
ncbi:Mss4-like protein [Schizothecium vesticola]|uniref:Mss4-like protein n=1 Tax=Schizothecium vesticola TaxID=314040 RepID=A0AA40F9L0_9PEZI|nr:Mss4-like protein [Schizothecium vesticola]